MNNPDNPYSFLSSQNAASDEMTPEEKSMMLQSKIVTFMQESCVFKSIAAGGMGFGLGGIFGLFMSSLDMQSMDPQIYEKKFREQLRIQLKDMGSRSYSSAKSFGVLGLIFAGSECSIEAFRAKTDIYNPTIAGFFTGSILARRSGPKAMVLGGAGFSVFSYAIEKWMMNWYD
ncbi:TIM22 inner membrane protein import complex subunit Tim22 [Schizosaccharomyces cryophilus OY26]|uniref:Mitochondrial import inner membrane translocase subunit TIM22 n=1 Tax=Schizosaccharomyces cryophilus (strain OY26 / ATCC MYA-4695 / CBS 11777 / NBRC 106824 / NRRL Y48691) TaxID=653667 RepID=S9X0Z3_SCHCR|nr:TIM22 inner membrane protein import complex subunit Tim22 [Schizosaccharomyces cryophilus OY26]EPY50687.1 TIM22 inner membrane protein import complex subunit Tim22 [Schizosaccharomyces cryophilus OY26]